MLVPMTDQNPHRIAAAAHLEACRAVNDRMSGDEFLSFDALVGLRETIQDGLAAAQVQATLAVSWELTAANRQLRSLRLAARDHL